jgi:hypothetical protein
VVWSGTTFLVFYLMVIVCTNKKSRKMNFIKKAGCGRERAYLLEKEIGVLLA